MTYQAGERVVPNPMVALAEHWGRTFYTIASTEGRAPYTRYYFEERPGWYLYDDEFTVYEEPEDEWAAPEGTTLLPDFFETGGKVHFVSSNKPVDELEAGDSVKITTANVRNAFNQFTQNTPLVDPINPDYYKFPSGVEVIDISEHLTSNGGQVVQYVTRSTRIDGKNKGDQLENLNKARWFLNREIDRLEAADDD